MRKMIVLFLSVLLLLAALTGCGTSPAANTPTQAPETPTEAAASNAFSPEGSVIFEKDGVKITTAGLDYDPTDEGMQPIIWVDIENSGERDTYLGLVNGSVNGFMADVFLISFYEEDGEYYGADYEASLTIPAQSSGRHALGYYKSSTAGVNTDTLSELEFSFATAEDEYTWYNYTSEPVVIKTGEAVEAVDITALGTVALDNDKLTFVIGEQDYDDWFGPQFTVYIENKTDRWIGLSPESAEGDGVFCDYMYGAAYLAPGKKASGGISFDGELRELKGIENLSLNYRYYEADSYDELGSGQSVALETITATFPPQIWGEYENGGLNLDIKPKYNDLVSVETPENDPDGILFTVSETASLEAGGFEGAGWLFSIGKVSEDKLHELLCYDMSGKNVFARDEDGNYYMYYHPTDVRYARATAEEMQRDVAQWTMLNEWAGSVSDQLVEKNGLESVAFGNSEVDMYLARAAWMGDTDVTLSTTEFGPVDAGSVDGTPYAEFLLHAFFGDTDAEEAPDGEYVVLSFPDEDVRLDFFFAPDAIVRVVSGDSERLYQAGWWDDNVSYAEAMQSWYYAAAEKAGLKEANALMGAYDGMWTEKTAGRGMITVMNTLAPNKLKLEIQWSESASVQDVWELTASLGDDGRLVYENGVRTVMEYDENGEGWVTDESWEESGFFYLNDAGELCWHNDNLETDEESVFIH